MFLAGGEIELSGFVPESSLIDLPIVGETRAYANATGDLHVDRIGVNKGRGRPAPPSVDRDPRVRGWGDLRHRATCEPIGEGLRPAVADPDDLVRMLEAHGREQDSVVIETMRRAIELDRGVGWER